MLKLKYHTPEGVMDYLPDECEAKRAIEQKMALSFRQNGYRPIQTPAFEYYDLYADGSGDISPEKLYKFFDPQGRILALRGDITTSIARVMGTKYNGPMPARLCYVADAFRYNGSASSRSSEFTQAGIELIGDGSCEADAEAIMVTISALLAAGLDEFQIDIGQVEFFKGLAEQVGLGAEDFERIRTHIDFKDSVSIAQVAKKYDADAEIIDILCRMPYLFGNAEVLEQAKSPKLNTRSAAALENLEQVYGLLCACGLEKYVSIDLGMLQSLDYYTGVIFKGVTYDVGFSVCGGGRYDTLIGNFGKDTSAVGIAIGVNRVLSALMRQKKTIVTPKTDALMVMGADFAASYALAQKLRGAGYCVENFYGDAQSALAATKARGIAAAIRLTENGAEIMYADGTAAPLDIAKIGKEAVL